MTLEQALADHKGIISVKDAAELLGLDPKTVKKAIDSGQIQTLKVGTRMKILRIPLLRSLGVLPQKIEVKDAS
jgi:excisionase family DNA binding protein